MTELDALSQVMFPGPRRPPASPPGSALFSVQCCFPEPASPFYADDDGIVRGYGCGYGEGGGGGEVGMGCCVCLLHTARSCE